MKQKLSVIYTVFTMLQPARRSYELSEICYWEGHKLPKPVKVLGLIAVTPPNYGRQNSTSLTSNKQQRDNQEYTYLAAVFSQ